MAKEGQRLPRGFTLIELLVTLTLTALLGQLAWTGFADFLARQRQLTAIAEVRSLVRFSRFTALGTRQRATLCALDSSNRCNRDWTGRHIAVFTDSNRNRALDANERLHRSLDWPAVRGNLHWRASLGRPYLAFTTAGRSAVNGSFSYCPSNADARFAAAIVVSHSGRTYVPGDSDGDGTRETASGRNLSCPL